MNFKNRLSSSSNYQTFKTNPKNVKTKRPKMKKYEDQQKLW